jgi:S-formylglutathione hydrolase
MPYTPIAATLGYVLSPDRKRVLMIHRNARPGDHHLGKYNGLGGKLDPHEDILAGMRREIREEAGIDGATGDWEFGEGAGFYLDATTPAYAARFRMYAYVTEELPAVLGANFARADLAREGVFGHSMGGHGALTLALKHPQRFRSVSAFAPIVAPSQVPWGRKALPRYLGDDPAAWADHDACELVRRQTFPATILIDQGEADGFLEAQLKPELFDQACAEAGQPLLLRRHAGYDHSYWFITSFIDDHLRHHAAALGRL